MLWWGFEDGVEVLNPLTSKHSEYPELSDGLGVITWALKKRRGREKGQRDVAEGGGWGGQRYSKHKKDPDPLLMASEMKGTTRQGMQVGIWRLRTNPWLTVSKEAGTSLLQLCGNWMSLEADHSPELLMRNTALRHLDFSPVRLVIDFRHMETVR